MKLPTLYQPKCTTIGVSEHRSWKGSTFVGFGTFLQRTAVASNLCPRRESHSSLLVLKTVASLAPVLLPSLT